jgi:hypothetical protein
VPVVWVALAVEGEESSRGAWVAAAHSATIFRYHLNLSFVASAYTSVKEKLRFSLCPLCLYRRTPQDQLQAALVPNAFFGDFSGEDEFRNSPGTGLLRSGHGPTRRTLGNCCCSVSFAVVLLEHHRAALEIESELLRVTTFRVGFPLAQAKAPGSQNGGPGEGWGERDAQRAG